MLISVADFRRRVADELPRLIKDLQEHTGRRGSDEEDAWTSSLPVVAHVLAAPSLSRLHLYLGEGGRLSVEYRLPASSSWCDVVLLGRHSGRPCAVIIELKHWITRGDEPGPTEGVMIRQGRRVQHPSDQVGGYVEYCRRFHSAVLSSNASVHGFVLFTRDRNFGPYCDAPNADLLTSYPCFHASESSTDPELLRYLAERIEAPDPQFAGAFETGQYHQDRGFVQQIGGQVLKPQGTAFELLEEQKLGFTLCRHEIEKAIFSPDRKVRKTVVVISGPPGTGKSAIAARLWAHLATDPRMKGENFVLTSTSKAQETNWCTLFANVGGAGAEGVVVAANKYAPLTVHQLGAYMNAYPGEFTNPGSWRGSLDLLRSIGHEFRMPDDHLAVSIVDEAHALLNPEFSDARGATGWPTAIGPQAYHIIRASTVSVFLIDEEQRFRERESTSIEDIRKWAQDLKAFVAPTISLHGRQFRCGGSKDYLDWVEALLAGESVDACREIARRWFREQPERIPLAAEPNVLYSAQGKARPARTSTLGFAIADDVWALESSLREELMSSRSARLVASYARKWVTKGAANPRNLPIAAMDFQIPDTTGHRGTWGRPWNIVHDEDYSSYVQAPEGSDMSADPLGEVGCPYVVRGFDFDYVGLIWLSDLVWRSDRWQVKPEVVYESGLTRIRNRARSEIDPHGPAHAELLSRIRQAYRILLTRAMRGIVVWFEDEETRDHVWKCLARRDQP